MRSLLGVCDAPIEIAMMPVEDDDAVIASCQP
jgi:hypothetical protein